MFRLHSIAYEARKDNQLSYLNILHDVHVETQC